MTQRIVCYVTDRNSIANAGIREARDILLEKVRTAIRAGVDWVQIREKDLSGRELLAAMRACIAAAKEVAARNRREVSIIINNRLDVAVAAGAAGVHLGGESLPAADVVRWCREGNAPAGFQVGLSCHSVEAARNAEQDGANHVFFGPVFDTPSKRNYGPPQGLERLREICSAVRVPVIAIGGVNEMNAEECIRAGAAGIAAIRLFQDAPDTENLENFISRVHERRQP